jgi:shikimate kinase
MASTGDLEKVLQSSPFADRSAPPLRLGRTLVLVGLMGAGKTSIGRRLADRLGVPFADADAEIQRAANATITEIFERDGEAQFRAGERRVIARLLHGPTHVLATGGGAFIDPETRARIRESAFSLWLRADLETLMQRVSRRRNRPLLATGNPRETMVRLMAERHPIYAEADLTVDSSPGAPEITLGRVMLALAAQAGPEGIVGAVR